MCCIQCISFFTGRTIYVQSRPFNSNTDKLRPVKGKVGWAVGGSESKYGIGLVWVWPRPVHESGLRGFRQKYIPN